MTDPGGAALPGAGEGAAPESRPPASDVSGTTALGSDALPGKADSEGWRRLHPLSPLLRGGIFFIVLVGIVIANFRDRQEFAPGDTIRFIPVDGYHNAETVRGMFPDGAEAFKGGIGEDFTVTLTQAGVYPVICKSHYALGMVAVVVVGTMPGREALERAVAGPHPLKAKVAFREILGLIP